MDRGELAACGLLLGIVQGMGFWVIMADQALDHWEERAVEVVLVARVVLFRTRVGLERMAHPAKMPILNSISSSG